MPGPISLSFAIVTDASCLLDGLASVFDFSDKGVALLWKQVHFLVDFLQTRVFLPLTSLVFRQCVKVIVILKIAIKNTSESRMMTPVLAVN